MRACPTTINKSSILSALSLAKSPLPRKFVMPARKGGNEHDTRTQRATRSKASTDAAFHVKKEEDVSTGSPGPVKTPNNQTVKHEAKPDASMKPKKRQKVKQEDPVAQQMVKLAPVPPTAYDGPFPKHMRPSPEECRVRFSPMPGVLVQNEHRIAD